MLADPLFHEARALVFGRLGQHKQALEIYVYQLQDPIKAEEYASLDSSHALKC